MTSLSLETNYLHEPSAIPMKYQFGFQESKSGRFFELRHNLSSKLYYFEGNMTVDEENTLSGPSIITHIWQKIRTPISDSFMLDLEQIINQTGTWSWETTVMRSGFMDMHVSAQWDGSFLDYYSKRFQFKSYLEDLMPSFNLLFSYSDRMFFYHRFEVPFEAFAYEVMIKRLSSNALIPVEMHFLSQDEFKTNTSLPMASLYILGNPDLLEARFSSESRLEQALAALQSTSEKVLLNYFYKFYHINVVFQFLRLFSVKDSTLNKILQPLLGQPTLSDWSRNILTKCTYIFHESLNLFR